MNRWDLVGHLASVCLVAIASGMMLAAISVVLR